MKFNAFLPYLITMAVVTYLVRAVPLVLIKKKIENKFVLSFLYYMPYAVLTVMTIPAVFFATNHIITAVIGVAFALILAYFKKGLLTVALGASAGVFITELIVQYIV
ncbi:MAG: AzlD domain-containing protein [Eubacterium sp.]|nr:AzlD domain-containing protein [Eubacterium sp.]